MASERYQRIVELVRARQVPPGVELPVEKLRDGMVATTTSLPLPAGVSTQAVDAGGVPAEWVVPDAADENRVLLYLHGGGYCIGSIVTHRNIAALVAKASGARTLLIDYRLAPEHPFPAALDDAVSAYEWLLQTGVDPARLAVAGDSAGGGLSAALLVALRDRGLALPACAGLISPWTDLSGSGDSITTRAERDPSVTWPSLQRMANWYLAGQDPKEPLASPLFADHAGLPPLLVQVGDEEILLDDSTRLAARAEEAGVDVTLEVCEEMCHVWHGFAVGGVPESLEAIDRLGSFIAGHTAARSAAPASGR